MRILITDDHALLSESLRMMMETFEGVEVVGLAYDGKQALDLCYEHKPDVVLMDIMLPVLNGVNATREIKKYCPNTKVIILTSLEDDNWVAECFSAGADGYILKDTPPDKLFHLIKCVQWGYIVSNPALLRVLKNGLIPAKRQTRTCFSEDDLRIIRLVSEGKSNGEIAEAMFFAEGTAKNKITKLIEAAGVENRAQLVMYALKNNLI